MLILEENFKWHLGNKMFVQMQKPLYFFFLLFFTNLATIHTYPFLHYGKSAERAKTSTNM